MDNNKLESKIETISKMMVTTKRSRMNAERRLLDSDKYLKKIVIHYSILIISISIVNLIINIVLLDYLLIVSSLIVLSVSLFRSSENLIERAERFKRNYIKIAKLDNELYILTGDNLTEERVLDIDNLYQDILLECENHKYIDYFKTLKKCDFRYSILTSLSFKFKKYIIYPIVLYIFPIGSFIFLLVNNFLN